MGDIEIDIDIEGSEKVAPALRKGLKAGLEDTGNTLLGKGEEKAEDIVTGARRVWTEEVKRGFESEEWEFRRYYHWKGKITNASKHADVVDRGLAPAGEITGSNPSVQDLMPWVVAHLSPADYDGGDGDPEITPMSYKDSNDFPEDISSDGGRQPRGITDDNFVVGNHRSTTELGVPEERFASDSPRIANLGDGTNVIWKGHNTGSEQENNAIRNEVVWSRFQELADWDLGPKSRLDSHEVDGEEVEGTIQEWIDDSEDSFEHYYFGRNDYTDAEPRDKLIEDHQDWVAKTAVVDYLTGNRDRVTANIRIDSDGNPRAIDSGGKVYINDLTYEPLTMFGEMGDYYDATNPEKLHSDNLAMLDRAQEKLAELADNDALRGEILDEARDVHGEDSRWYKRLESVIGEDTTDDRNFRKFVDYEGELTQRYKADIDRAKKRLESQYQTHLDDDSDSDTDPNHEDDGEVTELDEVDSILNDVFGDDAI